jgi:hypothetical protein
MNKITAHRLANKKLVDKLKPNPLPKEYQDMEIQFKNCKGLIEIPDDYIPKRLFKKESQLPLIDLKDLGVLHEGRPKNKSINPIKKFFDWLLS